MTTEFVSLYDEESGRTLGVLLMMSLGRKNERFNVKFFSVSLSVTTEFVSLYDEESGRTLGVLLMSMGRKNEGFNVKKKTSHKTVRSFSPTTSAVPPVSFLIPHRREIQILWSQTVRQRKA